ncbi:hypothetical protein D3C77_601900 [compost metagenome]
MRRTQLGAQPQDIAGQGRRIGRMEMRSARQQHPHHRLQTAQMAEVAFTVVRVNAMHVRIWRIRPGHFPGIELANFEGFFKLAHAARQKRKRPGGTGCMAQAQFGDFPVQGFEPVVQALAGADIDSGDLFRQLRNHQLAQPFVDGGEVVLFQQRRRVRLEQRVLEQ